MLKDGSLMKEATSRCVELPASDADTVRALLCLLHTDGACLDTLGLSQDGLLNVVSQAAEWHCLDVVEALIENVQPKISDVSHSVALVYLQVAALHSDSTQSA